MKGESSHPARSSPAELGRLEELVHDTSAEVLRDVASNPRLTEDLALALLARRDLPHGVIEDLSKNAAVMKSRKVINALVSHPRTPRYVSLPIARHLYTFELMQIALTAAIPADVKRTAEDAIVARLETVSAGERLTLAKRGSTRIAAALLMDKEGRIIESALFNPFLTEAWVVKAVLTEDAPQALIDQVGRHPKWSLRREIQVALLRNEKTPLARVLSLAQALPAHTLRDVLHHSRLSANVKMCLLKELETRAAAAAGRRPESNSAPSA